MSSEPMSGRPSARSIEATIQPLIDALSGRSELPPWSARRALEGIGEAAVPALVEVLEHGPVTSRWEAAKALKAIKSPAAVPALVRAIEDEDGGVRWLAAEALRAIGRPAIVPVLLALVQHSGSPWLREGAYHVLRSLSTEELAPILSPVLNALQGIAPEIGVMAAAERALAQIEQLPELRTSVPPKWHATRGPTLQASHGTWRHMTLRL